MVDLSIAMLVYQRVPQNVIEDEVNYPKILP